MQVGQSGGGAAAPHLPHRVGGAQPLGARWLCTPASSIVRPSNIRCSPAAAGGGVNAASPPPAVVGGQCMPLACCETAERCFRT